MWKQKNYLVFEHTFVMVPTFFERNFHCSAERGESMKCFRGNFGGGKAAILNLLSKYPELDETLLKWFWEKKSQDKSFILNQNFVV